MTRPAGSDRKIVARNKKALHEYHVLESWEAGVVLRGPEVKSIRLGRVSLAEAYARIDNGEVWLYGMHISPYDPASRENTDPLRPRKLLLQRSQIRRLLGGVHEKGLTLVPLDLYIKNGYVKLTIALARGKKLHDKREVVKQRDAEREMQRSVRVRS